MNSALARITALRPNKTWVALAMALAIGLGAAVIARSYLHRQMEAIEARGKSKTRPLIVAKRNLSKGEPISKETIAVRDVPHDYAHSLAIGPEDFSRIAGRALAHGMQHGDILLWNLLLQRPFESSSMGIRVDRAALLRQLEIRGLEDRRNLPFHRMLIAGELPQTMGGGIGQSRLCMFFLRTAHIGEVACGIWPESMLQACAGANISLL